MAKERNEGANKLVFRDYFFSRPLALSVIHLLGSRKDGMTATDLANELHMSVPTLYRLTLEMQDVGLLVSERHGRSNIFKISPHAENALPLSYEYAKKIMQRQKSKEEQLTTTKDILEEYNLSLSPKIAQSMVTSALKKRIIDALPPGVRPRNVKEIRTVLDEPVKFDFYIGTDTKVVAVELKIIETLRNIRERLGTLNLLGTRENTGLDGIIAAYMISPMGGQWYVNEVTIEKAINSLNTNVKLVPVISKISKHEILDDAFLNDFSKQIVKQAMVILNG